MDSSQSCSGSSSKSRKFFKMISNICKFLFVLGIIFHSVEKAVSISDKKIEDAFNKFDQDGNGVINRQELEAALKTFNSKIITTKSLDEVMKEADLNNDGGIDLDEFKKLVNTAHEQRDLKLQNMFNEYDTDNNNKLTIDEMKKALENRAKSLFTELDRDGNGFISRDEFLAANAEETISKSFDTCDKDGDDKITKDELVQVMTAKAEAVLGKLDTDGNGEVDFEEFKSALKFFV